MYTFSYEGSVVWLGGFLSFSSVDIWQIEDWSFIEKFLLPFFIMMTHTQYQGTFAVIFGYCTFIDKYFVSIQLNLYLIDFVVDKLKVFSRREFFWFYFINWIRFWFSSQQVEWKFLLLNFKILQKIICIMIRNFFLWSQFDFLISIWFL